MSTEIPNWLAHRARVMPDGVALVCGDSQLSWARLEAEALGTARRLAGLGIRVGDPVAVLMANGRDFVVVAHALIKLGAVLVPLNTRLAPLELSWQLADASARLLIYDAANAEKMAALDRSPELPNVRSDELERLDARPEIDVRERISLEAVHCVIYTSGTTGRPKGALITYGNEWWSAAGSAFNLGLLAADRWLACLPLFHVGGLSILVRSAIYGITAVVQDGFDPAAVNLAIDRQGITIVSAVASMLSRMLDARGDRPYPPALRAVLLGGGPAPAALLERCAALGVPVAQTYGLTEAASQVATLAPCDALRKPGSAGQPLLPTEIRIERDGQEAIRGEVGEIVVRGPTVTPGYLNRPAESAVALRGGWLHTGDLGYLDAGGYLYVLDRRDDLIVSGGENVYPAEIEAVLLSHPAVHEAGVVGEPDARWGQVPVAFVRLAPGLPTTGPAALIDYCRERLARYKVPARIEVVSEGLPRNAAGKLLRRHLRPGGR